MNILEKPILSFLFIAVLCLSTRGQVFILDSSLVSLNGDSRSANWVDLDNDGDLDIFITNGPSGGQNNEVYLNDGNGSFTLLTNDPLVNDNASSDGASWADTDGQVGLEGFIANWHNQKNLYYRDTNGTGRINIINADPTNNFSYSETGAWGDVDRDGFVDLIVTNSAVNKRNDYFRNNGDGTFQRITNSPIYQAFTTSRGVNWVDVDNDGDQDVYITNENNEFNELYINDTSSFVKNTTASIAQFSGTSMSSCWGDYDNDGDLDVFISNFNQDNRLYRNDGNLQFTWIRDSVLEEGGYSFSANWGDVDNDGDLDLIVGNAFSPSAALRSFFYLNNGNGTFTKNTTDTLTQVLGWTFGNALGDYDRDGDLDLLNANCFSANESNRLFTNQSSQQSSPKNWIVFKCTGIQSNLSAIGARLTLIYYEGGKRIIQTREISSQSSYCGQNMLAVHFGLDTISSIDSLKIRWPNGLQEYYTGLQVNAYHTLTEGSGLTSINELIKQNESLNTVASIYPNPTNKKFTIELRDKSNDIDLDVRLLDVSGKELTILGNMSSSIQEFTLPESLNQGIYYVVIKNGAHQYSGKLIYQNSSKL